VSKPLNQELGFDEVRWAPARKTSKYDARDSFENGLAIKTLLYPGTRLYRLIHMPNGRYFEDLWWMPKPAFDRLLADAEAASHGGGRLFRNYVVQFVALPRGDFQLAVVEIELTKGAYGWVGAAAAFDVRPGGMQQIFLPNLAERGNPRVSRYARVVHTWWLRF